MDMDKSWSWCDMLQLQLQIPQEYLLYMKLENSHFIYFVWYFDQFTMYTFWTQSLKINVMY